MSWYLMYSLAIVLALMPPGVRAAVRPEVGTALTQVKTLMQEQDYRGAQKALRSVELIRDLSGHESAQVWDLYGSIYQAQGSYGLGIRAYETVLAQDGVPDALTARALRALADLHTAQENPAKALDYLDRWAALSAPAGALASLADPPNSGQAGGEPRPTLVDTGAPTVSDASLPDQFVPAMDALSLPNLEDDYRAIVKVSPVYPRKAVSAGLEGYVIVECTVSETGSVMDASVVESSNPVFHRAAVKAVKQFRYRPRVVNGEKVGVTGVRNKITFRLE